MRKQGNFRSCGYLAAPAAFLAACWMIGMTAGPEEIPAASAQEAARIPIIDGRDYPKDRVHLSSVRRSPFDGRYAITDAERMEIAQVITAEAGCEPFAGKLAVAQCVRQTCEDEGMHPGEVLRAYKYTDKRPEPTAEAWEAVRVVFDRGQAATPEPIRYFYAPALVESAWHESQVYVTTIGNHRFFKEAG